MSATPPSAPPPLTAAILRAANKDAAFVTALSSLLADISQRVLALAPPWLRPLLPPHFAPALSTLAYAALTHLSLRQTLGEEYAGLLLLAPGRRTLPGRGRLVLTVLLQCWGPLLLRTAVARLERAGLKEPWKGVLGPLLPHLRPLLTAVERLHLAVFLLKGAYYHLPHRITGLSYVSVAPWLGGGDLRLAGWLAAATLAVGGVVAVRRLYAARHLSDGSEEPPPDAPACPLCLCPRRQPSLCPCGHLFCRHCLHAALAVAPHCPLCRFPTEPREVVTLLNYR